MISRTTNCSAGSFKAGLALQIIVDIKDLGDFLEKKPDPLDL